MCSRTLPNKVKWGVREGGDRGDGGTGDGYTYANKWVIEEM